jgi:hypothetical protein
MGEAYGDSAGGHTWEMVYQYHGHDEDNTDVCEPCHEDLDDFDNGGVQTEVATKLATLEAQLRALNYIEADGHYVIGGDGVELASSTNSLTVSAAHAKAIWDYQLIREDRSMGVHNPRYVVKLLDAAIAATD